MAMPTGNLIVVVFLSSTSLFRKSQLHFLMAFNYHCKNNYIMKYFLIYVATKQKLGLFARMCVVGLVG